jgi:acetyl-CoA acetyltransferase
MTKRDVCVIGVGMTKFERCERPYHDLVKEAVTEALGMASVEPKALEQAFAGYVNGMSCQGQQSLYAMGIGGLPVYNVHSYCSTGSSALHLGYQAIASGMNECVLAFGFEKMTKGPLDSQLTGLKEHYDEAAQKQPPVAARMFGDGGRQHMELYGTTKEQFAKVSVKNHRHSVNNPRSQYRDAVTLEEVLASRLVYDPLTLMQCCPTSDGAGAAILCSPEFAATHGHDRPVKIVAQALTTDELEDFGQGALGMIGVGRCRARGRGRHRAARLLLDERARDLRIPPALRPGRGRAADRRRPGHVRRSVGGEPVRRPALEGPPARRHRPRPMRRARLAAPGPRREAPGRRRPHRSAAQRGPGRGVRRDDVPPGLTFPTSTDVCG